MRGRKPTPTTQIYLSGESVDCLSWTLTIESSWVPIRFRRRRRLVPNLPDLSFTARVRLSREQRRRLLERFADDDPVEVEIPSENVTYRGPAYCGLTRSRLDGRAAGMWTRDGRAA